MSKTKTSKPRPTPKPSPENLRALRERAGMTQAQLGAESGCNQQTIAKYERPAAAGPPRGMSAARAVMIVNALRARGVTCNVEDLLT